MKKKLGIAMLYLPYIPVLVFLVKECGWYHTFLIVCSIAAMGGWYWVSFRLYMSKWDKR